MTHCESSSGHHQRGRKGAEWGMGCSESPGYVAHVSTVNASSRRVPKMADGPVTLSSDRR